MSSTNYSGRAVRGTFSSAAANGTLEEVPLTGASDNVHISTECTMNSITIPIRKIAGHRRILRAGGTAVRGSLSVKLRGNIRAQDLKFEVRTVSPCGSAGKSVYLKHDEAKWHYNQATDVTTVTFFFEHLNETGQSDKLKAYYKLSLKGVFGSGIGELESVLLDLSSSRKEPVLEQIDPSDPALEIALHPLLPGSGSPLSASQACVLTAAAVCGSRGDAAGQQARAASLAENQQLLSQVSDIQEPLRTLLDTTSTQLVLTWCSNLLASLVEGGIAGPVSLAGQPCLTLRAPSASKLAAGMVPNPLEYAAETSRLHLTGKHSSLVPGTRYKCVLTANRVWFGSFRVEEEGVTHVTEAGRHYLAAQRDAQDLLQPIQCRNTFQNGLVSLGITVTVGAESSFEVTIDLGHMSIRRQKGSNLDASGLLALLCAACAGTDGAKGAPVSLIVMLVPESSSATCPVVAFALPAVRVAEQPTLKPSSTGAGAKRSASEASSSDSEDSEDSSSLPPAPAPAKRGRKTSVPAPAAAPSQPPSPVLSAAGGSSSCGKSSKGKRGKRASSPSTLAGSSSESGSLPGFAFAPGTASRSSRGGRAGVSLAAKQAATSKRASARAGRASSSSSYPAPLSVGAVSPTPQVGLTQPPTLSLGMAIDVPLIAPGLLPDPWEGQDVEEALATPTFGLTQFPSAPSLPLSMPIDLPPTTAGLLPDPYAGLNVEDEDVGTGLH